MHPALLAFWGFAALNWIAAIGQARRLEYVAKPAALGALLWWAVATGAPALLLVALVFSLAGDVFLMLPGNLFAPGLAAFLVAHLAYLAIFDSPWSHRAFCGLGILIATAPIGLRILHAVPGPGLRGACAVYLLALVAMTASALVSGSVAAGVGGLLFLASDSLLAWNRFVRPWSWAHAAVMITYHLGQFGLVSGIAPG